jgi:hypothetical protein
MNPRRIVLSTRVKQRIADFIDEVFDTVHKGSKP